LSNTGQQYIADWLIMSVSVKSLLDDKDESMCVPEYFFHTRALDFADAGRGIGQG
jgi:hypothetical protein